jgi:hypothetical protein
MPPDCDAREDLTLIQDGAISTSSNNSSLQGASRRLFLIALLLPFAVTAASIDCRQAHTFIERAICRSKTLWNLDNRLGKAYKHALDVAYAPDALRAELGFSAARIGWPFRSRSGLCRSASGCGLRSRGSGSSAAW